MARKTQNANRRQPRDDEGRFQPRRSTWTAAPQRTNSRSGSAMTTGLLSLVGGAGVGAAIMYLMDPEAGEYRRTKALDAAHRALESTTGTLSSAYEGASHTLGDAWDTISHKAHDVSEHAAAALPTMPSARAMRRSGRNMLASARSYVPHFGEQRRGVSGTTAGLGAAGALLLGIGAMWLMDPARGRGRRAWLLQKGNRVLNETGQFMSATGRHLRNKMSGYTHDATSMFSSDEPTDDQLAERVRAELGRIGAKDASIAVHAIGGRIILTGRCVTDDVDRVLGGVRGVHGVSEIDNQLQVADRYQTAPTGGNLSA